MKTQQVQGPDDTELILDEIRHEASSLVHHPVEEVRRLTHVAADGDSPTTPLLVSLGVAGFVFVILAVLLVLVLLIYYYN